MKRLLEKQWIQKSLEITNELWNMFKFYPKVLHIHCAIIAGIALFLGLGFWPKNASTEALLYFFVCDLSHSFDYSLIPITFVWLAKFHLMERKNA